MEEIINQIIKIFEYENLTVAQAKNLLLIISSKLDYNSEIKIKKTT